jgi:hypothetical protein
MFAGFGLVQQMTLSVIYKLEKSRRSKKSATKKFGPRAQLASALAIALMAASLPLIIPGELSVVSILITFSLLAVSLVIASLTFMTMYHRIVGGYDQSFVNVGTLIFASSRALAPILIINAAFDSNETIILVLSSFTCFGLMLLGACKSSLEPHEYYNYLKNLSIT